MVYQGISVLTGTIKNCFGTTMPVGRVTKEQTNSFLFFFFLQQTRMEAMGKLNGYTEAA